MGNLETNAEYDKNSIRWINNFERKSVKPYWYWTQPIGITYVQKKELTDDNKFKRRFYEY